jgi:hypothetical protein
VFIEPVNGRIHPIQNTQLAPIRLENNWFYVFFVIVSKNKKNKFLSELVFHYYLSFLY